MDILALFAIIFYIWMHQLTEMVQIYAVHWEYLFNSDSIPESKLNFEPNMILDSECKEVY